VSSVVNVAVRKVEDRIVRKTALLLIGALVLPVIVSSSPAEARFWRGGYWRGGPVVGAPLVAGAVIGGLAASAYAYGPGYYDVPGPYGYYGYDSSCPEPGYGAYYNCGAYAVPGYGAPVPYAYPYSRW
jgi:hypothetical protein